MSTESKILVPVNTWFANGIDLYGRGLVTDIGAFAEALVYYDTVYLNTPQPENLHSILGWFSASDSPDSLVALIESGQVFFYHYDFLVNPIFNPGTNSWNLINMKEEGLEHFRHFRRVATQPAGRYFNTFRRLKRFWSAAEAGTIVASVDSFGNTVSDAKRFIYDPASLGTMLKALASALKSASLVGSVPDFTVVDGRDQLGRRTVRITPNIDEFGKSVNAKSTFDTNTVMAMATTTNRLIWSAAMLESDIYVSAPSFDFLTARMESAVKHFSEAKIGLERLSVQIEFPDIRREVNSGSLTAKDILKIREKSVEFREWFHKRTSLDADIIVSYYNDIVEKTGISRNTRRVLDIAFITALGTAAIAVSTALSRSKEIGSVVGGVSTKLAEPFVTDLFQKITGGWRPTIFGQQIKSISGK